MIRKVIILLSIFFCVGINLPIVSNATTVTPHVNRPVVHPFVRHHNTDNKEEETEDSEETTEKLKNTNKENNCNDDYFNIQAGILGIIIIIFILGSLMLPIIYDIFKE